MAIMKIGQLSLGQEQKKKKKIEKVQNKIQLRETEKGENSGKYMYMFLGLKEMPTKRTENQHSQAGNKLSDKWK